MNVCRLCGEEKSPLDLNIELNDRTSANWSYRELVEHHTRIFIKTNKLLPQSICEECRAHIDGFYDFSQRLDKVQERFELLEDEQDHEKDERLAVLQIVQLFPETDVNKHSNGSDGETDSDSNDEKECPRINDQLEDNRTFEEVFSVDLEATNSFLHLDVPHSAAFRESHVPESALSHLNTTRWHDLINSCKQCDKPCDHLFDFRKHLETEHNEDSMDISCSLCSQSFKKVTSFVNHAIGKHFELEHLRYCCLVCDMMFYNLVGLYLHVKHHHVEEHEHIFMCIGCGHHCEDLPSLKRHKLNHKSNTEQEIEEIKRIFRSVEETVMKRTLNIEDCFKNEDGTVSSTQTMRFKDWNYFRMDCNLCSKSNLSPIEYHMHHRNEHSERNADEKQQLKFTCNDCPDEVFNSLVSFSDHKVIKHEHDELSFRCIVCSRLFWNYIALSNHIKFNHPSFKPFFCMICGTMIARVSLLRQHVSTHHRDESKSQVEKRKKEEKMKAIERTKRTKFDALAVKEESDSESSHVETETDLEDNASSEEVFSKPKKKRRKSKSKQSEQKIESVKRRPNNRHRLERQSLYGPELDTPEKLFAEEINGLSIFASNIHLNVSIQSRTENGEVSDSLASSQDVSPLRWRDLLICAVCKLKFNDINSLTDHIDVNHGARSRAFGCLNCDIEYGALYESSLVNHLVERHYLEHLKFCCLVCSKLFFDFLSLVNHYKSHDGSFQILVCFICGFYAKTLDDLKEHKAYHVQMETTKPDNQMLCEKVLEKFNRGEEINTFNTEVAEYERNQDGTVTMDCQRRFTVDWSFAQYQCPLCFADHSNPFELFSHLRLKHPKEQDQTRRVYSCRTCVDGKVFSGMHYFINHAAELHSGSLRFTCVVCSRLFWNYVALANHYKNVHPTFTAVFCCHCGKLFHSITSGAIHYKKIMIMLTEEEKKLKKEGKLETEESTHICHICGKSCKNNYTLVKHITTHEEPDPSKMLQCHVCSKLFNSKNKLNQHMVGHNNLRKWKCKTCGMSFNFKKLLQMHTRAVHENERSFACTFCEKRFFKKYDLTVHVRLHTGDFPYSCPIPDCDAKYPAWSNLFKHCQSRHKLDIRSEGYKKLRASEKVTQNDDFTSD